MIFEGIFLLLDFFQLRAVCLGSCVNSQALIAATVTSPLLSIMHEEGFQGQPEGGPSSLQDPFSQSEVIGSVPNGVAVHITLQCKMAQGMQNQGEKFGPEVSLSPPEMGVSTHCFAVIPWALPCSSALLGT